jgi:glycosyltransferase involved in cell wall biosynthesis
MYSAVVLAKNEEINIIRCLRSLLWCDEIIILDDNSTDKTENHVKQFALQLKKKKPDIQFIGKPLKNDFSGQRNFALDQAKGPWVIYLDADEEIPPALSAEIKNNIKNAADKVVGFQLKRKDYFVGRFLRYGETAQVRLTRIVKKGKGQWKGKVHEELVIDGSTVSLVNSILHYPHPDIRSFLSQINFYTDLLVLDWLKTKKKIYASDILVYPLGKFIQNYLFRLGFLDGTAGLIMALMMSLHSFLARGKYWLANHN